MTTQAKIITILHKTGWIQAELADKLDVNQSHISGLIKGTSGLSSKTQAKLDAIAQVVCRPEFRIVFLHPDFPESRCWIRPGDPYQHGASNMTPEHYAAFKKAVVAANPENGGNVAKACRILCEVGFTHEFE